MTATFHTMPSARPFVAFVSDVLGVTLEPAQRVFMRVAADGVDPRDLDGDDRELAREMFGDVDEVPTTARSMIVALKGADVGWSFMMGLRLLYRALTADVSDAAPGEIRPALVVAPDLRLAKAPVRTAHGFATQCPAIARLIEKETEEGFVIGRGNGRFTSVECLPASVGGRATRGRRYVEVALDEACFFRDAASGVINDKDILQSVSVRVRDGTVWLGSTPWVDTSQLMILHRDNFGAPTTALAAKLPTLLVRTDPNVRAKVERSREQDPAGAATEFDCAPPVGAGVYFDGYAINQAAADGMPLMLERNAVTRAYAAIDAGFVHDSTGGVIVHRNGDLVEVAEVFERRPSKGKPLVPSVVVREFATIAKRHGVTRIYADVHYQESVREHLRHVGIEVVAAPGGHQGKATVFGAARELLHAGRWRWSSGHARLTQQAREVISRPLPGGGVQIFQPRRKGSGHGDILSAAVLAVWAAGRRRTNMFEALSEPEAVERFGDAMAQLQPFRGFGHLGGR